MTSLVSLTYNDFDAQAGIFGINTVELTAANLAAQQALLDTLRTEIGPMIKGLAVSQQISIVTRFSGSTEASTDPSAQRGNKWRISYRDTTQWLNPPTNTIPNPAYLRTFDLELPTADLTLREANDNIIYTKLGGGEGAGAADIEAFVAALEAVAKSPYGGTMDVLLIEAVTRTGG